MDKIKDDLNDFVEKLESAEHDLMEAGKELVNKNESLELKECQIKKLTSELNKCEEGLVRNLQLQQQYEDEKAKLNAENRKLLNAAETLKQNQQLLEKEMNELKSNNETLHNELKKLSLLNEEDKQKAEMLNYYKTKCEELSIHNKPLVYFKFTI